MFAEEQESNDLENKSVSQNHSLFKSQECIQRMEISSLTRFAIFNKTINSNAQGSNDLKKCLLFFTPCEELDGGSIFSRMAQNFNVIQPYIEKIDSDLIE